MTLSQTSKQHKITFMTKTPSLSCLECITLTYNPQIYFSSRMYDPILKIHKSKFITFFINLSSTLFLYNDLTFLPQNFIIQFQKTSPVAHFKCTLLRFTKEMTFSHSLDQNANLLESKMHSSPYSQTRHNLWTFKTNLSDNSKWVVRNSLLKLAIYRNPCMKLFGHLKLT